MLCIEQPFKDVEAAAFQSPFQALQPQIVPGIGEAGDVLKKEEVDVKYLIEACHQSRKVPGQ
jgi:hypothetical protein